jgi:FkbM family methyltransferase
VSIPPEIFHNGYTALKRCKHGYFLFSRNDDFIGRSLDLYGEWCEREIETVAQVVRAGDFVVDIGANIGTHTVALANVVTADGLVVAIEAQRQVYNYLVANVRINNLLHVLCLNKAAGAQAGTVKVPLLDPSLAGNFGALNVAAQKEGEPVEVITVDSIGLPSCRLIKIDVEGMEPQVLNGARQTIRKLKPFIFVEATLENSSEVISRMIQFGYDCRWHIADYFNPKNYFENSNNVFSAYHPESNLFCFPKEANIVTSGLEPVTGPEDNWQRALERVRAKLSSK